MEYRAWIAILFWKVKEFYSMVAVEGKCEYTVVPDFKECKTGNYSLFPINQCVRNSVCGKRFNVSLVNFEPYSPHGFKWIADGLFNVCCGSCTNTSIITTFDDMTQVNASSINTSHIVFPVLGRLNSNRVHTYYFLPILRIGGGYFVTEKQSPEELLQRFIGSLYNLWPLLVIMLFFSVIAGFVIWMMETWVNKEQFSRSFQTGLFDGFWWSFISMTTVGYGDKAPKFIGSRLFSVFWILAGITICSMFTASLTAELSSLNTPPVPNLEDSKVGILRNRMLDAIIVTSGGGSIEESKNTEAIKGVPELIRRTRNKAIKGFFLDKFTFMYVKKYFSVSEVNEAAFFNNKTEITKIKYEGDKMAYGILIKRKEDYEFFKEFILDNLDGIEMCKRLEYIVKKEEEKHETYLFSPSGGYFWPILIGNIGTVFAILCFGCIYELIRLKTNRLCKGAKRDINTNDMDDANADIETCFR